MSEWKWMLLGFMVGLSTVLTVFNWARLIRIERKLEDTDE